MRGDTKALRLNFEYLKLHLQVIDNTIVINVRKWWNWQTHHLEGVAPKGVGVQIPPSAPYFSVR